MDVRSPLSPLEESNLVRDLETFGRRYFPLCENDDRATFIDLQGQPRLLPPHMSLADSWAMLVAYRTWHTDGLSWTFQRFASEGGRFGLEGRVLKLAYRSWDDSGVRFSRTLEYEDAVSH